MLKKFLQEEEGQTLVEYGLLVCLIALIAMMALTILGRRTSEVFDVTHNALVTE